MTLENVSDMMVFPHQTKRTEAEYLKFEQNSDAKHEYAAGQIIAMTGASLAHNFICVNTSTSLNVQLRQKDCRVASNDLRLKIISKHSYRYPDIMVICGDLHITEDRPHTITNPIVIVEVLSESTALIDRNEKLDEYLQIDSVQEYILISQHDIKVERYLRQSSGDWLYTQVSGLDNTLDLPSIGCKLALAEIYHKVDISV